MSRELDRPFEEVLAYVNALDNEHGIALKALIRVHDEAAEGRDSFRHILERAIWRKRAPAGQARGARGPRRRRRHACGSSAALARPAHQELDRRRRGAPAGTAPRRRRRSRGPSRLAGRLASEGRRAMSGAPYRLPVPSGACPLCGELRVLVPARRRVRREPPARGDALSAAMAAGPAATARATPPSGPPGRGAAAPTSTAAWTTRWGVIARDRAGGLPTPQRVDLPHLRRSHRRRLPICGKCAARARRYNEARALLARADAVLESPFPPPRPRPTWGTR